MKRMAERCGENLRKGGAQRARRVRGTVRLGLTRRDIESREVAKLVLDSTLLRQQEQ
jgi:hypothetical protein